MTTDRVVIVDSTDLRTLRLQCRKCHAAISFPIEKPVELPPHCPACHAAWDKFQDTAGLMSDAIKALGDWLAADARVTPPYQLRIELRESILDDQRQRSI